MTDRIHALTVVLDDDYRTDDVEPIVEAIKMLRGVLTVEEHVANMNDYSARSRVRAKLEERLWKVLREELKEG